MWNKRIIALCLLLGALLCGCAPKEETPFFQLRGVVLAWDDLTHPETLDWMALMKETGMNTISIFGKDYQSPEYYELKKKIIDMGIDFEYEEHGMTWMLPRELFAEHPEYFRMDENGNRTPDYNGCPSSQGALQVVYENVKKMEALYRPSNHKYYFWLNDGGDKCHCPDCESKRKIDEGVASLLETDRMALEPNHLARKERNKK